MTIIVVVVDLLEEDVVEEEGEIWVVVMVVLEGEEILVEGETWVVVVAVAVVAYREIEDLEMTNTTKEKTIKNLNSVL